MVNIRHSCNANATHFYSSNLQVDISFAERDIKAGEEIFIAYHNFKSISKDNNPEFIRCILLSKYGVVCPLDCACRDPVQIGQVQEAKSKKRAATQFARQGKFREAFQAAKELLRFLKSINLGIFQLGQTK
jgi:SET domain-containing protein